MDKWRELLATLEEEKPQALARYKWWRVILTPDAKKGLTLKWQGANTRYQTATGHRYEWVDVAVKH